MIYLPKKVNTLVPHVKALNHHWEGKIQLLALFSPQSTVLAHLKRRVQNVKGYEKKKTKRSGLENKGCEFGDKEVEELHAQLLKEVQSKKKNYAAIKEIQENSFEIRRREIHEKTSDKCVVGDIAADYPFFQIHECIVSITISDLY